MEIGSILQFIIIAGVVVYGVWSAAQKSAKQDREVAEKRAGDVDSPQETWSEMEPESGQEMTLNDYFPTSSMADMSSPSGQGDNPRRESTIDNRRREGKGSQAELKDNYPLAASSIQVPGEMPVDDEYDTDKKSETHHNSVITKDLRTIIISSELLKPKYLEY